MRIISPHLLLILLLWIGEAQSQNLSDYQWNNRLVLLLSDNPNDPQIKQQASLFLGENESMTERKLILIQAFPKFNLIGTDNLVRRESNSIYFEHAQSRRSFELRLIGLDGDTKYRSNEIVPPQRIYELIDAMPMRKESMN